VRSRLAWIVALFLLPIVPAALAFDQAGCGAGFPTGAPTATVQVVGPLESGTWSSAVTTTQAFARAWIDAEVTEQVGLEKGELAWRAFSDYDANREFSVLQEGTRDIVHFSSPWEAEALCWRFDQDVGWTIRDLQVSLSITRAANATLDVWIT